MEVSKGHRVDNDRLSECCSEQVSMEVSGGHLVDKDRHSKCWPRQVSMELLQVVLPLALPGQVHEGRPFAPPQLYQFSLLINACIEPRHLQPHDAHGIQLVADGSQLVAHGPQLVADGSQLVADGIQSLIVHGIQLLADGIQLVADGIQLIADVLMPTNDQKSDCT